MGFGIGWIFCEARKVLFVSRTFEERLVGGYFETSAGREIFLPDSKVLCRRETHGKVAGFLKCPKFAVVSLMIITSNSVLNWFDCFYVHIFIILYLLSPLEGNHHLDPFGVSFTFKMRLFEARSHDANGQDMHHPASFSRISLETSLHHLVRTDVQT